MVTPPQVLNKERKGMRLLLISDTHGKLDIINELSAQTQADAVIHAGDFGFYDDESFERLSDRELKNYFIRLLPRVVDAKPLIGIWVSYLCCGQPRLYKPLEPFPG
jgi:hypothetical protein